MFKSSTAKIIKRWYCLHHINCVSTYCWILSYYRCNYYLPYLTLP